MPDVMPIPAVTQAIISCWMAAETTARDDLAARHPDKDEDFITESFHDSLRISVDKASKTGHVQDAFYSDLTSAFPFLEWSDLRRLADGLAVTSTLHPRRVEGKTGGDMGIVFIRPNVTANVWDRSSLTVDTEYCRGLLCQAKIRRRNSLKGRGGWGTLTRSQQRILPNRLGYLSLLLYEYEDANRRNLFPFRWQLCAEASFVDVKKWLSSGTFPDLIPSDRVLERLGGDEIGTNDRRVIDEYIAPHVRDTLVIRIGWPPDESPPREFPVAQPWHQQQRERACAPQW